ncbi:MAG: hydrogenase maturation nickel metallochaperone HypA [Xanthobacteraceae bacterium]|nr:hydrogenase maturation nickel metallochaperone HypA [Xanthobacteraceae bacterium]
MHEMALCEGVIEIIETEARKQSFARVKTVWLEIGALSQVEPEAMRFCFEVVAAGSVAAEARLEIVVSPGVGWCMSCVKSVPIERRYDPCPCCGGYQLQVTAGDEMRVKELEVA